MKPPDKKMMLTSAITAVVILLAIQAIPYGKAHSNPPIVKEPLWDSPATRVLVKRVCFDCHSNETVWPAYSKIAPVSWLVQYDVDKGREELNFSNWIGTKEGEQAAKIIKQINKGEMPPLQYLPTHPEASLSPAEKESLLKGLAATATH